MLVIAIVHTFGDNCGNDDLLHWTTSHQSKVFGIMLNFSESFIIFEKMKSCVNKSQIEFFGFWLSRLELYANENICYPYF